MQCMIIIRRRRLIVSTDRGVHMKEIYETPEMDIVKFDVEDVITVSEPIVLPEQDIL